MLKVRDIMTRDLLTVCPDTTVRDAIQLLAKHRVSGAPVMDGPRVVGVISTSDLLDLAASLPPVPTERDDASEFDEWPGLAAWEEGGDSPSAYFTDMWADAGAEVDERFAEEHSPEWDPLVEHTVSEAMTHGVCALPPRASVWAAADYMQRAGVHRILVVEAGRLVGLVSASDIAAALGAGALVERRPAFDRDASFDERGWT